MTRLGEDGVVLALDSGAVSPFANRISQITLPARWSAGISSTDAESVEVSPVSDGLVIRVGEREFLYSRKGLNTETRNESVDQQLNFSIDSGTPFASPAFGRHGPQ